MSDTSDRDSFEDLPFLGELRGRLQEHFIATEDQSTRYALQRGRSPRRRFVRSTGASTRLPQPGGPAQRKPSFDRSRPLLVLAVLLLAGGTATAAVTLSGTRSAPLSGSVPGSPSGHAHGFGFTEAGKQYRIVFVPQLSGGEAGWRTFISFGLHGKLEVASGGEGGYPTHSTPLAGGAGVGFSSSPLPSGDVVDYVLGAPRVAAVRLGSRTIETRSSSALPAEDRAAVFFVPAGSPSVAIPPPDIQGAHYTRVLPAMPSPSWQRPAHVHYRRVRVRTISLIPLDRSGHRIAYTPPHPEKLNRHISSWQIEQPGERHPGANASHPLPGACEIAAPGLPGLQPQWRHVLTVIQPITNAEGELFLSCVDTEYSLHGWPLDTAILLDARQPGRTLGPIPGASPVVGHPGVVNVVLGQLPGDLTARRIGNAWLVVEGGASLAQRLQVLDALRIAKLSLPAPGTG